MNEQNEADNQGVRSNQPLPSDIAERSDRIADQMAANTELRKIEKEMNSFERSTIRWARAAVVMSAVAALFVCLQWVEMRRSSTDTHALAEAAKAQADAARVQSQQAKAQSDKMAESLRKTDDLILATSRLAIQARRSADIANRSLEMDQRPWLGIVSVSLTDPLIVPHKATEISASFVNTGKSPALGVNSYVEALLLAPAVPTETLKIVPPINANRTTLFPGGSEHVTRTIQPLSQPMVEDIFNGKSRIIVYGQLSYFDVFKRKHWTNFCLWYSTILKGFTYCDTRNDTDDRK